VHIIVLCLALFLPQFGSAKRFAPLSSTTVNLVSMQDIGGGGGATAPKKDGAGKKAPEAKTAESKDSSGSKASGVNPKPADMAPVKRLKMDEPSKEAKIEKYAAAEVPTVSKKPAPSVEENLDKLIPKPKPQPAPKPVVQPEAAKKQPAEKPSDKEKPVDKPSDKEKQKPVDGKQTSSAQAETTAKASNAKADAKDAKTAAEPENAGAAKNAAASGGGSGTGNKAASTGSGNAKASSESGSGAQGSGSGAGTGTGDKGAAGGSSSSGSGAGQGDSAQVGLARRLYYTAIYNAIKREWRLPETIKTESLEAVLLIMVRRDGKVLDIKFEKKSGNAVFDESVVRAVRKCDPLPAFPEIYSVPQEEIGLRFRPEDLA
jgi:TolA protein